MGKLWCASLPVVTVPRCAWAKPVTLVTPYYENPEFFAQQLAHWRTLKSNPELARFSVIVVDDGSPTHPARAVLSAKDDVRLFEIHEDRRWNWLAARNIGMHHAAEGWCVLTD